MAIIGAGLSGLMCGSYLAEQEYRVALIERNERGDVITSDKMNGLGVGKRIRKKLGKEKRISPS